MRARESTRGPPTSDLPIADTHTHLADHVFDGDRAAVLERARAAGVRVILVVTEGLDEAARVLEVCSGHPMLRAALGLYPGRANLEEAHRLVELLRLRRGAVAAIGEVGLDHWLAKDTESRELQVSVLDLFIEASLELDLPLNVHSRSAGREVIEQLVARGARRVQLHAFDGRGSTAARALEAGYYFSVPPSIVHSQQKRKLVRSLPPDRILLETDSPVLGPVPGERNEPANTLIAAREIAAIRGVPVEAVLESAWENTRLLYTPVFTGEIP